MPRAAQAPHDDLAAALAARRELGPEYDDAFADAVAERLGQSMAAPQTGPYVHARTLIERENAQAERRVTLTIACFSLGAGIPLTGIAAGTSGLAGLLVAWTAIAVINVAYAFRPQRHG
jgi:hypothetical protein